jgi:hypothetical protein
MLVDQGSFSRMLMLRDEEIEKGRRKSDSKIIHRITSGTSGKNGECDKCERSKSGY